MNRTKIEMIVSIKPLRRGYRMSSTRIKSIAIMYINLLYLFIKEQLGATHVQPQCNYLLTLVLSLTVEFRAVMHYKCGQGLDSPKFQNHYFAKAFYHMIYAKVIA